MVKVKIMCRVSAVFFNIYVYVGNKKNRHLLRVISALYYFIVSRKPLFIKYYLFKIPLLFVLTTEVCVVL